jgi:hypothetical protein
MPTKKDVISVEKFIEKNTGKSMWDLNTEEAVENRLLEIFGTTLTSDNHYIDATTPLDVTTGPLKDIADLFEADNTVRSLSPLFPSYQEDMKSKNTGADAGIGPMALINVFRTFLQIADIQLNTVVGENNIMQKLGIDTTDWTRINAFCQDQRISGKVFGRLTIEELDALAEKIRAIQRKGGLKQKKEVKPSGEVTYLISLGGSTLKC